MQGVLPHLHKQITQQKKVVWYFRIGHGPRIRLPGPYGSPEFMRTYHLAAASQATANAPIRPPKRRLRPKKRNFYLSKKWKELRYRALARSGRKCECCGSTEALHVDHIKPRSKYPELELELTNLQVLCEDCNMGKGAWDETDWRPGPAKQQIGA